MTVAIGNHQPDHLAERPNSAGHLQLHGEQSNWTDEQRAALVQIGLADAPEADLMVFLHYCQRTGLDPFAKQIYMIKRWDAQSGGDKYTIQAAIEGLRLVGERHPQYAGQTEPEWCGEDGVWRDVWLSKSAPSAARVKVMRRDWDLPAVGVVHFDEFAQTKKGGGLTHMWATKQAHMIAKCAEAAALRKAFPHDLSGLYTEDEMGAGDRPPGRVTITQRAAPVTSDEIRGISPKPAAAPVVEATEDDRMSQPQQRKLFALIREHNITDRNDWASGLLGRDIASFGQLTQGEACRLIDNLEKSPTPPAEG